MRALVLGAGGHAAIAWEIGVIAGLADGGLDVRGADVVVGTSAGSIVGAQVTSRLPLEELYQRQIDPSLQTRETAPAFDPIRWRAEFLRTREGATDATSVLQRYGAVAASAPADAAVARREMMMARLPSHAWPASQRLLIVAVDVDSGERRVFDRESCAHLVDAVLASSAVPGVWPVVSIAGRRYMDGGMYSIDNADLAAGCDEVLIVTMPTRLPALCVSSLESAVASLERGGAHVRVVHPDERSQAAFASTGGNVLDPAVRTPAALAGREQGRALRF